MIVALACFTFSAACLLILYCQAILRDVSLPGHLRDACRAVLRGQSPPRVRLPRPRADWPLIRELERDTGMEPWL